MNKDKTICFLEDVLFVFPYLGFERLLENVFSVRIHRANRERVFLLFALINGVPGGLLTMVHPLFYIWLGIGVALPLVWWGSAYYHPFGYAWLESSRKIYRHIATFY